MEKDIEEKLNKIDEAIEAVNRYSYLYNLKIIGAVPKANTKESSKETVDICLNLFNKIGAEVSPYDIDIAHRVTPRDPTRIPPIICKVYT